MGYLADGRLVITGRQKDLIIVNGRNIWPQDLEWHAEEYVPDVRSRDAAAFSVEDEATGKEIPVMLVQCRLQDPDARIRLRDDVHAAVFRNAGIDCRVILIPARSLPFTTSGKLSRAKAKQAYLQGAFESDPAVPPGMERQAPLAGAALKAS
jgi:fatty-acyl-CoA synthase